MSVPATRLLNRGLLLAIFGGVAWLVLTVPTRSPPAEPGTASEATPTSARFGPLAPPGRAVPEGPLLIPVAGVAAADLADSFAETRSSGRRHEAIDIMAPRGTPVLAAADGRVEKLYFSDGGGGITAYVRSPDRRWLYYYAHLDRYAPGLAEGEPLRRGSPIGFVGSTGSASADAPHLHFAVKAVGPDERWWQGIPINPYPLLAGSAGR